MRPSISDLAIVLTRLDYAEKDRILTILTSRHGKLRAIAKGVRSAKSKLAGGIELFAENELVLIEGKGDLYTLTSSRMKNYFGNIAKDVDASMYAYECLKMVNKLTPDSAGSEYFETLKGLLNTMDKREIPLNQVKIWFALQVLEILGSLPNFLTDANNKDLQPGSKFQYDFDKHCFFAQPEGIYGSDHIKILRFLAKAYKPVEIKNVDEDVVSSAEKLLKMILADNLK